MSPETVTRFERAFADWLGTDCAFAFWKGRVAMYAILRALGVGDGDEVVLPGYTCVMDVNPVMYVGARPVYVDIEPVTYNMDVRLLEDRITPRTKVIIAQHTYGYPCDMDPILEIADRHGVTVVEDCCLAMGSRYRGKLCGTFGRAAYWSFQWNKPFTTGIGGMATTNDAELAGTIQALCEEYLQDSPRRAARTLALQRAVYNAIVYPRTTAWITRLFRWMTRKGLVVGSSSTCEFQPDMPEDFFMGMSAGQARAGLKAVRRIDRIIAHRRHMGSAYARLLSETGWDVPEIPEETDPVLVRYPVRVADKDKAVAEAPGAGVEIGTWFECPLHPIETPMEKYGYQNGQCPVAEQACREVINLPTHPRASEKSVRRGVEFVQQIGAPDRDSPDRGDPT